MDLLEIQPRLFRLVIGKAVQVAGITAPGKFGVFRARDVSSSTYKPICHAHVQPCVEGPIHTAIVAHERLQMQVRLQGVSDAWPWVQHAVIS